MAKDKTRSINIQPFDTAGDALGPSGTNYLLAIAIDEYVHCPALHNCLSDAQGFIEVLKERYDFPETNIQTLFNEEATRANIHAHLKGLKERVQPRDSLIIYFSGHGETEDDVGYWVPVEAHPDREWEFVSTNDIKSRLDAVNSFHTFVIVDACFSGSLFASYRSVKAGNETKRSRLGLAASHSRERALDGTAGENSPFSTLLLKKLRENTGILGAHKLAAELIEEVHAATRGKQTPVFKPLDVKGDDAGQFIFRLRADEGADWKACQETGTLAAYEVFLAKYPEGKHADEAQEKIVQLRDEAAWQSAESEHTVAAYFQYRQDNPEGQYRDEALAAIQQVEEDQAWQQAQRKNSIYEYEHYLERYSEGRYREEAQDALQALLGSHAPVKKPPVEPKKQKAAAPAPPKVATPPKEEPVDTKKEVPPAKKEQPRPKTQEKKAEPLLQGVKPVAAASAPDQASPKTPSAQTPVINKKYLLAGGAVLLVLLLAIWGLGGGGSEPADSTRLERFMADGKYGYRDSDGKEVLAAQYEQAEPFQDGRARVTLNGQAYMIDPSGARIADASQTESESASKEETLSEIPASTPGRQEEEAVNKPNESGQTAAPAQTPPASGSNKPTYTGKTFRSGSLTWMAENLDYPVSGSSWCYSENSANCRKYGRLYTWAAAQKACAAMGWRLPTAKEWAALQGQALSGVSPQLSGFREDGGGFRHLNGTGYYWSKDENALGLIKAFNFTNGELEQVNNDPRLGYSCRCVR